MDDFTTIPLHSTKYPGLVALIDAADLRRVGRWRWNPIARGNGRFYAAAWIGTGHERRRRVQLHRYVLDLDASDPDVDHKNGDGLDCRRQNIRLATQQQNNHNRGKDLRPCTSRFKGVYQRTDSDRFMARIWTPGKRISLGVFADEEDAARAYDDAARIYHGEFARLNFPN